MGKILLVPRPVNKYAVTVVNAVSCCLYLDFLPLATFIIFSVVTALCSCLFLPQVVCTTSVRLWRRTQATVRAECSKRRSLKSSPASDETLWRCSPNCMHLLLVMWHPTFVLLKKKLFWVCMCLCVFWLQWCVSAVCGCRWRWSPQHCRGSAGTEETETG